MKNFISYPLTIHLTEILVSSPYFFEQKPISNYVELCTYSITPTKPASILLCLYKRLF